MAQSAINSENSLYNRNIKMNLCNRTGHNNGRFDHFCKTGTCKRPVCAECIIRDHRDHLHHDVVSVVEVVKERLSDLNTKISDAKNLLIQCQQKVKSLTLREQKFKNYLNQSFKEKVECAENENQQLRKTYTEEYTKEQKHVSGQINRLTAFINKATEHHSKGLRSLNDMNQNPINFLTQEAKFLQQTEDWMYVDFTVDENEVLTELENDIFKLKTGNNEDSRWSVPDKETFTITDKGINIHLRIEHIAFTLLAVGLSVVIGMAWHFADSTISGYKFPEYTGFFCKITDANVVSMDPYPDFECGSKRIPYKFEGVFGNISYTSPKTPTTFSVSLSFENIDRNVNPSVVLFEIGLTSGGTSNRYLYENRKKTWAITGFSCINKFGLCVNTTRGTELDINVFRLDQKRLHWIVNIELYHSFWYGIIVSVKSDGGILLAREETNLDHTFSTVFAIYHTDVTNITMTLNSSDFLGYNRSTLHRNLFITSDNKSISNKPLTGETKTDSPYFYINSDSFTTDVQKHFHAWISIEVALLRSHSLSYGNHIFDVVLGKEINGTLFPERSIRIVRCKYSRCLLFMTENSLYSVVSSLHVEVGVHYDYVSRVLKIDILGQDVIGTASFQQYLPYYSRGNTTMKQYCLVKNIVADNLKISWDKRSQVL